MQIAAGEVVALLGPQRRQVANQTAGRRGVAPADVREITIAGRVAADPVSGIHRAPHGRPIEVVFQDYLLFPHLTVLDNVAFGPLVRGMKSEARRRAADGLLSVVSPIWRKQSRRP